MGSSHRRHARHAVERCVIATLVVLVILFTSSGCGGPQALTGGSIPIGSALLKGVVVRADNVGQGVSGATVTLTLDANHSATRTTDANGAFAFQQIAGGSYACVLQPPSGSDLAQNWLWVFDLPDSGRTQIVAAIWPHDFDVLQVATVTLAPTQTTLHVGQSATFNATALDLAGHTVSIRPSMLLLGDIGDLSPNGSVQARTSGQATLVAWVNGHIATAQITVVP